MGLKPTQHTSMELRTNKIETIESIKAKLDSKITRHVGLKLKVESRKLKTNLDSSTTNKPDMLDQNHDNKSNQTENGCHI